MNILLTDCFYVVVAANFRLCETVYKPEEASRAYPRSMCVGTRIQEWGEGGRAPNLGKETPDPCIKVQIYCIAQQQAFYTAFGLMEN